MTLKSMFDGHGLRCMHCGSPDLKITTSRAHDHSVRRRRHCNACNKRFWTKEVWTDTAGHQIRGQDTAFMRGLKA